MKKLALLTLLVLLVPGIVYGQCSKEGDPAFFVDFGSGFDTIYAGQTKCYTLGPANFGFVSGTCPDTDTFCVAASSAQGWVMTPDPALGTCYILMPGYLWWQEICITAPCDGVPCDYDTVIAIMAFCDTNIVCAPDCGDCEDPNIYGDPPGPYYSIDTLILHIVETPPALYILQDSISYVEQGQTSAYVGFEICNGDPCADPTDYSYIISSKSHVGGGFPQSSSVSGVPGGECVDVYAVVDAGAADVCDYDTLTIIAWDTATGTAYDTCVQLIHVVEPEPVPLFTRPVVTILVLAMILAAAVIMRRRAFSKA